MIHKPRIVICKTCGNKSKRMYYRDKQTWIPIGYFCKDCQITGLDSETSIFELKPSIIYEGLELND